MSAHQPSDILNRYREVHQQLHGNKPTIELKKGYFWIEGRGGFLPEEIEAMTAALLVRVSSTSDASGATEPVG